jgi:Ca-activated chloride channel family protein
MFKNIKKEIIVFLFFAGVGLLANPACASKEGDVRVANSLFERGVYDEAILKYLKAFEQDTESSIINFNLGSAYYKNEEYLKAIEHLQKGLLSEDVSLQQKSYYNLGNANYMTGFDLASEQALEQAVTYLEKALNNFENAIALDDEDEDATINFEIVQKELEKLKEQMNNQKENQKEQGDKKDSKDQEKQGDQSKSDEKEQDQQKSQNKKNDQPSDKEDQANDDGDQQDQSSDGDNEKSEDKEGQEPEEKESSNSKQDFQSSALPTDPKQLTQKEAEMILNNYLQTEGPQKLLNFQQQKGKQKAVLKDW